jgi:elongation factor 1-gamma
MSMKIYNWRVGNVWVDLAVLTANFAKVQVEEVFVSAEDLKTKEWKAKSLSGKTPMLETPEGNLVESAAIARYIASQGEGHLAGANAWETAQINQWVDYSHTTILAQFYPILRAVFGWGEPVDAEVYNNAVKEMKEIIKTINVHLQGKTHLVSNRLTVADISVAVMFTVLYQTVLDAGFRKAMPNVAAWLETFVKLPEVTSRLGNIKFAAKGLKASHVAEKKKEEVKAPVAAPKKAAATEDGEEGEKKSSGKNPLDLLPPSPFVLPDFKTYFVNLGDKKATDGMEHFFKNYDPSGYSIYFVHYDKYEGEGVVLYQTSNLMNGFLQRMDEKFRNYTMSLMAILGDEPNLEIQGVWMFRGKGIPQEMIDHPQFEYYQRRELDVTKEEDRKTISEFWCAKVGGQVNGQTVQEIKMFK